MTHSRITKLCDNEIVQFRKRSVMSKNQCEIVLENGNQA